MIKNITLLSELGFIRLKDCRITTLAKLAVAKTVTRFRTVPQFVSKIVFISIIFLILFKTINAQTKTIDSLRQVIKTAKHDTTRINAYLKWGEELILQNPDSTLALEFIAKEIAEKFLATHTTTNVADTAKKQLAEALNNIGYIYNNQGDIPKALEYYNKSLNIREVIGDKSGIATSFNNIGMIYKNQGDIPKALEYYNKSLNIWEEIGDKQGMAMSFNNIGQIYDNQSDIPKALEYYNKSLNIQEEIGNKKGMADSFNNIGVIYYEQGDIPKALEYYIKSLNIEEEIGDKEGMAYSFNNVGSIYKNQANEAKSRQDIVGSDSLIKKALEYFNKSLNIREEIGDKNGMTYSFNNIGSVYFDNDNIALAKSYIEKGYKLSKKLGYPVNIEKCAGWLKKIYLKQGNHKLAYEFYSEEMFMHDSIQNEENYKQTQKQQAKYEYEKKAATDSISNAKAMEIKNIELLRSEEVKKKQRVIIMFVVCGLLLVVVFSVFLFRLFMQKKKANLILASQKQQIEIQNTSLNQANEEITAQRDEISAQRDTVTKQKEHIEHIHKEVTDSINYAERIQRSFLATKDLLDVNLNSSLRGTKQSITNETNYFVLFHPKDVVSGDFYWAGKLSNGNFALVTADSTGHGVPGAIMSILNISSIEKAVEKGLCEPSEILNHTRKSIIERLKKDGSAEGGKDGMDASLICFDFAGQKFLYSAANNPIWVVRVCETLPEFETLAKLDKDRQVKTPDVGRGFELIELSPDKMPIGKHDKEQISFSQSEFQLQKGDIVYTLTDGFQDQFGGPKGKKFLSKRLKEVIIDNCLLTMKEQKQILETTLVEWIGNGEQVDDITILGIRI